MKTQNQTPTRKRPHFVIDLRKGKGSLDDPEVYPIGSRQRNPFSKRKTSSSRS